VSNLDSAAIFIDLKWDTDFFGVSSAKATLYRSLTLNEWEELKTKFNDYQFVSIVNQNSEPVNSQMIGNDTSAFLADINIQFEKKIGNTIDIPKSIRLYNALKRNEQVLKIADFQFSKFIEDPNLAKRGGDHVYRQWIINAFDKPDKYFALSRNANDNINGFVLFSLIGNSCVIELIAVSHKESKSGIGGRLFHAVEYSAAQSGVDKIKVGTQLRNTIAINFYHKVGCKQIGSHQVYHLWNTDQL
jgi:dTDP-4-amino-4,6-dideoxy-D-galactose acyltransferase